MGSTARSCLEKQNETEKPPMCNPAHGRLRPKNLPEGWDQRSIYGDFLFSPDWSWTLEAPLSLELWDDRCVSAHLLPCTCKWILHAISFGEWGHTPFHFLPNLVCFCLKSLCQLSEASDSRYHSCPHGGGLGGAGTSQPLVWFFPQTWGTFSY